MESQRVRHDWAIKHSIWTLASQVALVVKNLPANAGDAGSIPGSGRYPEGGHGNSLQYSCLENPVDRGAWQAGYSPYGPTEWDTIEEIACTLPSSYYRPRFLGSGLGCFDQEKQGPCSHEIYLLMRESTNQSYPSPLKLMAQDVYLSPAIVSSF